MADPRTASLLAQLRRHPRLDPRAVLAVARTEGLGGGIGDQGTSFGPFQLHYGGAYPSHAPRGAGASQAWAWSPEGLNYALNQIAGVARGRHGADAIRAIVQRFERPADPGGEIQRALGFYGQTSAPAAAAAPGALPSGAAVGVRANPASAAPDFRQALARALLQQVGQENPDYSNVTDLIRARHQASATTPPPAPAPMRRPAAAAPATAGINELFYDPLGGIKYGKQIGAIGHHSDHVHVALSNLAAQLAAEQHAAALGLHVGEEQNNDVNPVHVKTSYHYRNFPGSKYREAADISGDPAKMAAFYRWIAQTYGAKR